MVINIMVPQYKERVIPHFVIKDKISALTHFIGFILSIVATPILLIKGALDNKGLLSLISYAVFLISMILLYGASSAYHSFNIGENNVKLRKLDHMMISILIAGTYTPLCVSLLSFKSGNKLLIAIWTLTVVSMILKAFWINSPRIISSLIYLMMGWTAITVLPELHSLLGDGGFRLLILGGILYSIGALIYAFKLPQLERNKEFKSHELFHLFILGGTLLHYLMIYFYVA